MDPTEIFNQTSNTTYDAVQIAKPDDAVLIPQPDKTHRTGSRSPYKDG